MGTSTINNPVSNSIATVSYVNQNIIDVLREHIALLGGGTDPGTANKLLASVSATTAIWTKINYAHIDAIDTPNDQELLVWNNSAGKFEFKKIHYLSIDATNTPSDGDVPVWNNAASKFTWRGAAVPVNAVIWFPTAATLTAAGANWARYTSGDGRFLMGAGTTFGVTFTENTGVGSSWGHTHGPTALTVTGGVTNGPSATAAVQAGAGVNVPTVGHTHNNGTPTVGGTTDSTSWQPPAIVGVWGQRI